MSRIRLITSREGLTGAQQEVFERIASGVRKGVRGPHTVLLNNPELASRVESLGRYVRYDCSVPQRLRELAILAVAVHWQARYEWYAHSAIALEMGISPEVQAAIAEGHDPAFESPHDRVVFNYVAELLRAGRVSDELFKSADSALGTSGVLDLTALVGYYTFLALTLNAFQVEPPTGSGIPF